MVELLLDIQNLRAGYGQKEVLAGVDIQLKKGETAALLGLNGSGKSTLLRAALGLHVSASGSVLLGGENLLAAGVRRRAQLCAYIPQRNRIDEGMTALELVLMGANARMPLFAGYSGAQRREAEACLAQLGMARYAETMMRELSQGQRQLAIFARAMMQRPQVFLLDEPDSALDLPNRREMMLRVQAMTREGSAALIVLHDAALALEYADSVLLLHEGRIKCRLDMKATDEEQVSAALRMLYGDVRAVRLGERWAVLA